MEYILLLLNLRSSSQLADDKRDELEGLQEAKGQGIEAWLLL